jgi:hypothetical protein
MAMLAVQQLESTHPSTRLIAIRAAAQHLRVWLAASGLSYGCAAREQFTRAHPTIFGNACELTLRGYERWRTRLAVADRPEAFAHYIASRHQRWMDATEFTSALAPCLVGTSSTEPCWLVTERTR